MTNETKTVECFHMRLWLIPVASGMGGWCYRCGAIKLTNEWQYPDHAPQYNEPEATPSTPEGAQR